MTPPQPHQQQQGMGNPTENALVLGLLVVDQVSSG